MVIILLFIAFFSFHHIDVALIISISSSVLTNAIAVFVPVLLTVVFFTLVERHVMASMQRRVGPNASGIGGLLQAIYDGLKLGLKEPVFPDTALIGAFILAPCIMFVLSVLCYCCFFFSDSVYQGLIIVVLSGLSVYGVLLAGWSSNSKYAFLGSIRSVSQMISYELGFGACLLSVSLFLTDACGMKSLNFSEAHSTLALIPIFILFLICSLGELKRLPFDLSEAEAELVAGYNVEYTSLGFALFFISEYANMAVMGILACFYFLGGFSPFKLTAIFFFFVWVRATLPRYRYDQFLRLGWKALLPLSLSLYSIYAVFDFVS
jgi:NADH:ubiquinone oxidoreductase subunit H